MEIKAREVGSKAYAARYDQNSGRVTCPDCLGTCYIKVVMPTGEEHTIPCATCSRGYEPPSGKVTCYAFAPKADLITIDRIDIAAGRGGPVIKYITNLVISGACSSYRTYDPEELFDSEEDAMAAAIGIAKAAEEENQKRERNKIKANRNWAWHVTYHRREIKRHEEDLARHRRQLAWAEVCAGESKMKITNKHGLPEPIYQAILNDPYSKGDADYSVTQIIAPVRQTVLVQRHEDELEEDAMDRIWALMGKTAHKIFEDMPNYMDAIKERRFSETFNVSDEFGVIWAKPLRLSGQADYIEHIEDPEVGEWLLRDFKMTSVWGFIFDEGKPKDDWIAQLNALKVLAAAENVHIGKMEITCIFRDWNQGEMDRRIQRGDLGHYPRTPVVTIGIPEWPYEQALEYITDRLQALEDAKDLGDDDLPECTAEERWEQPTKYAVMKEGRKSAVRVLDSREAADEHMSTLGPKHSLEVRRGGSRRCQQYCAAAPFCSQWEAEQEGEGK